MLRRWFSLRSMMWHVLMLSIVGGCCYAAWWQFHRAAAGNALSYLYSVEWPAFAIMAVIGWWQLVTEKPKEFEARREARRQAALPKPVAYDTEVLRRELTRHPELVEAFPELVKAFPELMASAGEQGGLGPAAVAPALAAEAEGRRPEAAEGSITGIEITGIEAIRGTEVVPAAGAGSPGAGRPALPARGGAGPDVAPAPSEEIRAYNEVLGQLAARGRPKTWRNPRGKADR